MHNKTSELIRNYRKTYDLTQQQLASKIGLDRTTIVKYESGKNDPSGSVISDMAEIFGDAFLSEFYGVGAEAFELSFRGSFMEHLCNVYQEGFYFENEDEAYCRIIKSYKDGNKDRYRACVVKESEIQAFIDKVFQHAQIEFDAMFENWHTREISESDIY